ncbi:MULTISPECIES: DNA polymerase IV [Chryseobacterium]|jgi:DNA polymerase-4|uniref:DNA polymerase IV n=2 Tax=Chryseobacterium gleum TaxID=250 RepID=A0A3S4PDM8_CHRGE|nr:MULTISPECIES: DNA polymerase IV [Chryseobacterium]ASE61673.1 DNA polymerase IV [Chryseobacterium indologenes]AZB32268.1 DNA polymerase IV [Chryseobacterium bernardetii]EFK33861.1 ImpB/MucB/SamB family protein [Chryseobacterium gleum ATCC 35910]MDG4650883.1 DNA polymerase IV [Chryseobacterium arthrosphaerae]QQY34597.1 DNA polymerase IV [Chryseobacterium gleum]
MRRAIAHMDLDTFFVSCERLRHSVLEKQPVIIGGGDRGVVASCSYEARKFGVRSAMPIRMALRLCPEAQVIKGDMEYYSNMSHMVTEIIQEKVPVLEKASVDEFYLDLSGMDKFFGCYQWTTEIADAVTKQSGLPISFALSTNKTVSKIGTGESKPAGRFEVKPEYIQPFLNPLSVKKIPMVGDVTFQLLSRLGVRKIETLSQMPVDVLQQLIGKNGTELWKKANGIDNTPVIQYSERKSISTETTFTEDTIDVQNIRSILSGMVEQLCYQLRHEQWLTSTVSVRIRYANFDTETKQCKVPYTSADHTLLKYVLELFRKVYTRRMRIRLVGVKFTGLVHGSHQMNLFEDTEELISLYQTMDKIKDRFGVKSVGRASGLLN